MFKQLAILAALAATPLLAQAQSCSRDSLKAIITDYFRAVEKHDISLLATAPNLRITENGVVMKPGEGFFQSGGKVHLRRDLLDTERCATVTEAVTGETIKDVVTLAVVAVRLKVDQGKVSEIETLVTREAEMKDFYRPIVLLETKDQDWTTLLPADKRLTREYMNDGAYKYFDCFVKNPSVSLPLAKPCYRWEGGSAAAKDGNCMPRNLVLTHTHRRFPVTDLELGATAAFVNFAEGLPDVHIFKYNAEGKIYNIQAIFGGRTTDAVWPDEKR